MYRQPTTSPLARAAVALLLGVLLTGGASAQHNRAASYYEDALRRFERKDAAGAIIQLKNALQADRTMLPVHVLMGKAQLANSEPAAAEVSIREALRLGVSRAELAAPLAEALSAQGKLEEVLRDPTFSPTGVPRDVQKRLLLLRAAAASDLGEPRKSMTFVDEARAIEGPTLDVLLAEVPIRIRAREFKLAAELTAQARSLAPASAEAWYQQGSVAHVSGDLAQALEAYSRAIAIQPGHVEARVARTGVYLDRSDDAAAAADLAELAKLAPGEPRSAYLRALLAERKGDTVAVKTSLHEVTALLDPVPLQFLLYRRVLLLLNGLAHFALNEREKAKPYLEAFHRVQTNTPASRLLAQLLLAEPDVVRAIEVIEAYLKGNPQDPQALILLATAQMAQGRHALAASLMQQALRRSERPEFRAALGFGLVGLGQSDGAMVELEAALKSDPTQAQAAVLLAQLHLSRGDPRKAVEVLSRLHRQAPSNPGVLNLLGIARARLGDPAGGRQAFEQAARINPALDAPPLNLARMDIATGALDAATARLDALLKRNEHNIEAMVELSNIAQRRGNAADARRWLEKAVSHEGPRDTRASLVLVGLHLRAGRVPAAMEAVKVAYGKAPEALSVLLTYAQVQLALGDPAGARSTLSAATRSAGFDPDSQVEVAALQLAAGNVAGANYSLDKALSTQADFLPALALMVEVEMRRGEDTKAEQRARRILERHPRLAIGHTLLGRIEAGRGQPAAAVEAYRRAFQVQGTQEELLRLFGLLSTIDFKAALALAHQWLGKHPGDAVVQGAVADALARNGQFAAAREAYQTTLKLEPDNAEATNNLANVMLRLNDPAAIPTAERAVALAPDNADHIDTLGWALFLAGQTDRALPLLRDAKLRQPARPEIRYHLAAALAKMGRRSEAQSELAEALRTNQRFSEVDDAEKLLRTLQ